MSRLLFFFVLTFCPFGCKKEMNRDIPSVDIDKHYAEMDILNKDFKVVLDSFILNTKIYSAYEYDDILITLYKRNNDTVIAFENTPPFELENLKSVFKYDNYKFYCYVPDSLYQKLNTLIKIEDKKLLDKNDITLDTTEIDIIYRTSYIINEGKMKLRKVPLEWSTDMND